MIRGIRRCFLCKGAPDTYKAPGAFYLGGRLYKGTPRGTLLMCNSCLMSFTPDMVARFEARRWRWQPLKRSA